VYYQLSAALKRRLIKELRHYWEYHPKYTDLVANIQGKYSFQERPQHGMVVRVGGASQFTLSPDNYIGVVVSYTHLAKVKNFPGTAIEWVKEDAVAIQNNGGNFPSRPGVYFIELTEDEEFYVDPLLDVVNEHVTEVDPTTFQLQHAQLDGTLRLFEMDAGYQLYEPEAYTATRDAQGKPTGEIILNRPMTRGRYLAADYRHVMPSTGPHKLYPFYANNHVIPGVVLAFGNRNKKGDRMAIVVEQLRQPSALEYGGRWDVSFDIEIMSRDVDAQEEITDQTMIYLFGILRSYLSSEGIEMLDLSMGGEAEEVYDENGDDYFYTASLALTLQADWSVHLPLSVFLRSATPLTLAEAQAMSGLPDEVVAQVQSNIKLLEDLGLEVISDPFFGGRGYSYETLK